MVNYSVRQVSEVCVSGLTLPWQGPLDEPQQELLEYRPPLLRRRTRASTITEPSSSRHGRLRSTLGRHRCKAIFALFADGERIYVSEEVKGAWTTTFLPFRCQAAARQVEIQVFVRAEEDWRRLLRRTIDLTTLVPVDPLVGPPNRVLLHIGGRWCCEGTPETSSKCSSYTYAALMRLLTASEFCHDTASGTEQLRHETAGILRSLKDDFVRAQDRIRRTTHALNIKRAQANADRARLARMATRLTQRRNGMQECKKRHKSDAVAYTVVVTEVTKRKDLARLVAMEIRRAQRGLVGSLSLIYPIDGGRRSIRSVQLLVQNELTMGASEPCGYGFLSHLVMLLAYYLQVPLRYPMRLMGSTSSILDPVSIMPSTSDPLYLGPPYSPKFDRRYPLFPVRGTPERHLFALFLLNKNVEQLLQARGLVCGDLRDPLGNLNALIFWIMSITEEERDFVPQEVGEGLEIVDHADMLRARTHSLARATKERE
ncbi:hypothetical protein PYCC9005_004824 [Savitreella phatthalungensis]